MPSIINFRSQIRPLPQISISPSTTDIDFIFNPLTSTLPSPTKLTSSSTQIWSSSSIFAPYLDFIICTCSQFHHMHMLQTDSYLREDVDLFLTYRCLPRSDKDIANVDIMAVPTKSHKGVGISMDSQLRLRPRILHF